MINVLRKNIGTVIAAFGFALLCILTFGDLGEIMTDAYWENVKNNLTSIGFMSVALTMIQVSIKQGLAEQALQRGLNTEKTATMYKLHKDIIKENNDRMIYLPYFLQSYNERHTKIKKQEFLVNNNFSSEQSLMKSGKKKLINKYLKLRISVTASRIKWATTDVVYNKKGQIQTLAEHRSKRAIHGIIMSLIFMLGMTLLARGLFFQESTTPIWQKFVQLLGYIVVIAITSVLAIIKEYEKGAFGVPNDLEDINEIWREFKTWTIPEHIIEEVKEIDKPKEVKHERVETKTEGTKRKEGVDGRTDIQAEQEKGKDIQYIEPGSTIPISRSDGDILLSDGAK